ncbi:MAG: hypothetical protein LBF00_02390 [Mycoplasmataceae bacterium]|jgi:restriction endonuclease S subunit|nr:hypothetical protein [Mycoplasmataceae bacterium]
MVQSTNINDTGITILIVVGCVALFFLLFALIYMIIAYRKIGIVAKKLDYLVEDLTYKSEILTPTVDAIAKIANFIDLFESLINQNTDALKHYVSKNKETTTKFIGKLKDIIGKDK